MISQAILKEEFFSQGKSLTNSMIQPTPRRKPTQPQSKKLSRSTGLQEEKTPNSRLEPTYNTINTMPSTK